MVKWCYPKDHCFKQQVSHSMALANQFYITKKTSARVDIDQMCKNSKFIKKTKINFICRYCFKKCVHNSIDIRLYTTGPHCCSSGQKYEICCRPLLN